MTTLVGIVARKGTPGIVLASDLTITKTPRENGSAVLRKQTKKDGKKIYADDKSRFAVCTAGAYDTYYKEFLFSMIHNKIDMADVIKKGHFEQLLRLNLDRFKGEYWNQERQNELLVASRFYGKPELHVCMPLGKVEKAKWGDAIGSGAEHAHAYVSSLDYQGPDDITIEDGINIAADALDRASTDIYTSGLDVVIVTGRDIYEFGKTIRENIERAKEKSIDAIIDEIRINEN